MCSYEVGQLILLPITYFATSSPLIYRDDPVQDEPLQRGFPDALKRREGASMTGLPASVTVRLTVSQPCTLRWGTLKTSCPLHLHTHKYIRGAPCLFPQELGGCLFTTCPVGQAPRLPKRMSVCLHSGSCSQLWQTTGHLLFAGCEETLP